MKNIDKKRPVIFLLLLTLGSSFLIWGFLIEPDTLRVNEYKLKLRKWSPKLNNFKIIAISDIHAGSNFITEEKIRHIVSEANAQNPDLIVLLGDYVSISSFDRQKVNMPIKTLVQNLSGLRAKYGIYAVLGNQDEEYDKREVKNQLEKIGIRVLVNESESVEINGEKICLLGMQDKMPLPVWRDISNYLKLVLAKGNSENYLIVLVHNPDYLPVITGNLSISDKISLILAGHTHGGQVRLPIIGAPIVPSEYGQKYVGGYIRDQETDMFVTTGIGTSKIPVRFGVTPEIAVLIISAE